MTIIILDAIGALAVTACSMFLLLFSMQVFKKRGKTLLGMPRETYTIAALIMALCLGMLAYTFYIEPNQLVVRHLTVSGDAQARFVFISDAHVPQINPGVFEKIRQEKPDAILFGGDIRGWDVYSDTPETLDDYSAFFSSLSQIAPVYAVTGTHDWNLPDMNATFLRNEKSVVGGVSVCGVDDDVPAQVSGCDVALVHSIEHLQFVRDASITLLGHTHGGGINLPVITEWLLNHQLCSNCGTYRYGEHIVDGKRIYVTSGIANYLRFLAPPEIVVVEVNSK